MGRLRYRLQRKETVAMPNILGGHSFPVHTYRWRDIAASDDKDALENALLNPFSEDYRIIDTDEAAQR